jgi:hypothetical protein
VDCSALRNGLEEQREKSLRRRLLGCRPWRDRQKKAVESLAAVPSDWARNALFAFGSVSLLGFYAGQITFGSSQFCHCIYSTMNLIFSQPCDRDSLSQI